MGEGLVTGKRVSSERAQNDPPVDTQHGNSARCGRRMNGFIVPYFLDRDFTGGSPKIPCGNRFLKRSSRASTQP
jgi:hypothetical protein